MHLHVMRIFFLTEYIMSRFLLSLLVLATVTSITPATAQDTATAVAVMPKVGQVLRDASGRRLGAIERIQDGAVMVIMDMHMYRIPTNTLSLNDKGLQTSLKRADLR